MNWKAYNELAWTDKILAPPESYREEAMTYVKVMERFIKVPFPTMLHMGCGAGGHDFHFKQHFSIIGVDLSEGMLDIAKTVNPEISYMKGDMRNIKLNRKFDAVVIPDSIGYMSEFDDLLSAIKNAAEHLKPEGVLLVVANIKEEFRNNNFAYTGEKDDTHVTLFENNHILPDNKYEATIVYLIRQGGILSIYHEIHSLGLFSYKQWLDIFEKSQLKVHEISLNDLYDKYLVEGGEYKLRVFIGTPIL